MRGALSVGRLVVLALACLTVSAGGALACDACSQNTCTPGFSQGTFGCSSAEVSCSAIARIFFGCVAQVCSTSGNTPCSVTQAPPRDKEGQDAGRAPGADENGVSPGPGACTLPDGAVVDEPAL